MQGYILSRLSQALITLLILSSIVFYLGRLSGDPVSLLAPLEASEEQIQRIREIHGLDKSGLHQYGFFLKNLAKGDFGNSIYFRRPVKDMIMQALPNSLKLAFAAVVFSVVIGLPLGVLAAVKKGTVWDSAAMAVAVFNLSIPAFWLGVLLIQLFAVNLKWLPPGGMGGSDTYVLPAITLGGTLQAGISRLTRSSMIEAMDSDYVKFARIKGVSEWSVVWKHALKNASIAVITFAGIYLALLITVAVVVEAVFAWPGIGRLAFDAIVRKDYPVIEGVVIITAMIVIVANLIVDILYAYIDPRIRYKGA